MKKQIVADESVALNSRICAALSAAIPKTRQSDLNALPVPGSDTLARLLMN